MRSAARKREIVAFQVDEALAAAMDQLAQRQFRSRSDIMRQALLRELEANGLCPTSAAA
jgi:predicted transcriptional regulator